MSGVEVPQGSEGNALPICPWEDYTQIVTREQMPNREEVSHSKTGTAGRDRPWIAGLGALLFALAYGQSPLFTSNQNQYFLHGLAAAGYGELAADWLATTADPTPIFSALVQLTASFLPLASFYGLYGLLLAAYFLSLRAILFSQWELASTPFRRALTSLGLILLHAGATRFLLSQLLGADVAFLLEGGLAGQRLLGAVLQPSAFGVLLVIAILLAVVNRPYAAVVAAVAAATVHPTYLLTAGGLTAGLLWILYRRFGRRSQAIKIAGLALLLVLPILFHAYIVFQPSSPTASDQAARILVEQRIPHHALPSAWFGWSSVFKLALIAGGVIVAGRSRLRPLLVAPLLLGGLLSGLQLATGSHRLALLFPWRVSALLVPLCAALLLGRAALTISERVERVPAIRRALLATMVLLALLAAGAGVARTVLLAQQRAADPAASLFQYVRENRESGDRYLIPPRLQRFRLATGAPAFVDFKAIPYRDVELLGWNERLELAEFFYRDHPALISCDLLPRINSVEPITHVVLEQDQFGLECPGLNRNFANEEYALYRYRP